MSNNSSNYMDRIPVKISEKFKPPKKLQLPQSVCQKLSDQNLGKPIVRCDFGLENNVLKHISEWRTIRDRVRNERKERLSVKQLERQKQIEEEQKTKLNQVCYPNTDDLSSTDDEDCDEETSPSNDLSETMTTTTGHFSPLNKFDSILTPTILPENNNDEHSQQQMQLNHINSSSTSDYSNIPKIKSLNKINYSDFENDTSSPFDNMELKTINDLAILAQVLNLNTNPTECQSQNDQQQSQPQPQMNCNSTTTYDQYMNQPQTNYQYMLTSPPQLSSVTNSTNTLQLQQHELNSNNFYTNYNQQQQQQYMLPIQHHQSYNNYYQHQAIATTNYSNYNNFYYQNQNNYNYAPAAVTTTTTTTINPSLSATTNDNQQQQHQFYNNAIASNNLETTKSKSKSVPDIVQQLNNEITDSEIKRIRNNSQTLTSCNNESKPNLQTAKISEEHFTKLSNSLQNLSKNISLMGFPLERVVRIVNKFGKDDKKIIEHLIPLSELLDLGFDECKISDALIKYENDKDKALDYLIS
uniref:Putative histone methyltransferase complex subunit ash2 n=1 Tax=Corethrella appendiculata TaxID=1370023 RepID=U5EE82_9DIPT